MSILNDKFNRIVCINLKERPDKKDFIQNQFNKFNIKVEFYHPVILGYAKHFTEPYIDKVNEENHLVYFNKSQPNEFGTLHSHYTVIKSALLDGIKNLFIFEDDCVFHKNWNELLPKYMDTIPEDADGILLYSYMSKLESQNIRVKPRWTKGYASWSLLAYGLNERAMKGYIDLVDSKPMIADEVTWRMMTHMDFNFYVASPALVIPSKSFNSDIRGDNKNYEKTINAGGNIFMLGIDQNNYE
ncbi:glycosyltransferase family 25 protein [bacterium]|jgi:GR25 family glycosyltransferase involved in LPS biosynthesis|nr:glycosyltransferase family 25 protein [bacterium]